MTSTSPLPITHQIPWRCENCGERGTITLTATGRAWTRQERMTSLFHATVGIHPCSIIYVYWELPESWTTEVFS